MNYSHTSHRVVLIAVLVVVGLLGMGLDQAVACKSPNFSKLYNLCGAYVNPSASNNDKPSKECCNELWSIGDIPCACKYVTKAMESYVDPKKAIKVAEQCKITVKPGTKCGSYTVPGA